MVLFSNPQHRLAPSTSSAPVEKERAERSLRLSSTLAAVMSAMASHMRLPIASRKSTRAKKAVAAISKLPRREAVAALARLSPSMSRIGAAISSSTISRM